MTTYTIDRIADLLRVPLARRSDCLRELEYGLALHELAFGEDAVTVDLGPMQWTDDGNKSCVLSASNGEAVLTLRVTDGDDAA